jgi:hypothetical protein
MRFDMAKYESNLRGDFYDFLEYLENGIIRGSISASYEDGSDYVNGGIRCAVRVYERYSILGKNRVSLSVTLVGDGDELFVSIITAGGSQAMFFKINTLGEHSFLQGAIDMVESYKRR